MRTLPTRRVSPLLLLSLVGLVACGDDAPADRPSPDAGEDTATGDTVDPGDAVDPGDTDATPPGDADIDAQIDTDAEPVPDAAVDGDGGPTTDADVGGDDGDAMVPDGGGDDVIDGDAIDDADDADDAGDADDGGDTDVEEPEPLEELPWRLAFDDPYADDALAGIVPDYLLGVEDCPDGVSTRIVRNDTVHFLDSLPHPDGTNEPQMVLTSFREEDRPDGTIRETCPFELVAPVRLEAGTRYLASIIARPTSSVMQGFRPGDFGLVRITLVGGDLSEHVSTSLESAQWTTERFIFTPDTDLVNPRFRVEYIPPFYARERGVPLFVWGEVYIDNFELRAFPPA